MTTRPAPHPASIDAATAAKVSLVADPGSPVGRDAVAAFLAACEADAAAHDGKVSVNRVSAALAEAGIPSRRYSSLWGHYTGEGKPMRRTSELEEREGSGSGNNGKWMPVREWVALETCDACEETKPRSDMGPTGSDGKPWCQDCYAEGVAS